MGNSKRKQLTLNLGNYHDQWLTISNELGVKPATLAAAVIKAALGEHLQPKNSTHFDTMRPLNFDMKRSRNFDTMRPFNFEVIRPPNFDMYFYHSLTFSHLDSSHDCIAAMLPFYFMSFLCHKEKHFFLPSSVQSAQII